ncbi:MAG: hypothetical protein MZU79_02955 [Anaerotruncus sp.]|nr:hypothetical protein [Anaerotruncus sp.]
MSIVGADEVDLKRNHIKLALAPGARIAEVGGGRPRRTQGAGRHNRPDRA